MLRRLEGPIAAPTPPPPRWFVDKASKVPLYLQLRDLVEYYVSTGAIAAGEQLPTVSDMAQTTGITFETVRKAYNELERDGLLASNRGRGTFVKAPAGNRPARRNGAGPRQTPAERLEAAIEAYLRETSDPAQAVANIHSLANRIAGRTAPEYVVFTECNVPQVEGFSKLLRERLGIAVHAVLLPQLKNEIARALEQGGRPAAVITTGFHVQEVRSLMHGMDVPVDFVITRMSPEARRELDSIDHGARFGFVCRDEKSIPLYRELLRSEFALESELRCCTVNEERELAVLLQEVDVLFASPTVIDQVTRAAPEGVRIFNVFDWVDPMSVEVIRERLTADKAGRHAAGAER